VWLRRTGLTPGRLRVRTSTINPGTWETVTSGTAYNIPPLANDGNPPPNWEVEMTLWNLIGGVWVASPEVGYCASGYTGYPTLHRKRRS
jgi:hypothetical protein